VVSHELSHVKAKDSLFKSISYTLNVVSFFNPLSYFTSSLAQKERELLADENGAVLLGKPALMARVLTKVEAVVQQFPAPSLMDRFSSSLFLVSPLAHRPSLLASHPQISQRIQNIQTITYKPNIKRPKTAAVIFLLGLIVSLTLIAGYSTMQIQKNYSQNTNAPVSQYKVLMYNATAYNLQPKIVAFFFPNLDSYLEFTRGFPNGWESVVNGTVQLPDGTEITYSNIVFLNRSEQGWS
jgi:hypothetical protein